MSKHTPAPWKYDTHTSLSGGRTNHIVQRGRSGGFVVKGNNAEQDARLIASAPELLEALKALARLDITAGGVQDKADNSVVYARDKSVITVGDVKRARQAIAKAEGTP